MNATKEIGLRLVRGSCLTLSVDANAHCAEAYNDQRFESGIAVLLGDTPIGCMSTTQKRVTTATCEAEYVAVCDKPMDACCATVVLVFLEPDLSCMRYIVLAITRAQRRRKLEKFVEDQSH